MSDLLRELRPKTKFGFDPTGCVVDSSCFGRSIFDTGPEPTKSMVTSVVVDPAVDQPDAEISGGAA